jgi:hypothetical protein
MRCKQPKGAGAWLAWTALFLSPVLLGADGAGCLPPTFAELKFGTIDDDDDIVEMTMTSSVVLLRPLAPFGP